MLSGVKHLRCIFYWAINLKLNPRFFASLRMTVAEGRYCANHEIVRFSDRKSKQQDEEAGDHQRNHPHQIDIEPRTAQYCDSEVFVNHNRDESSR